jgi:glycosyltransferase involved in cell wall biosynthesis
MKILFIAPLPPPVNGQSKAGQVFLKSLNEHIVNTINLSKSDLRNGVSSFRRIIEVIGILTKVWLKRRKNDAIYFSLSESFAGNLKDLLIYLICYKSNHKIIVHMLGGVGMKKILESGSIFSKINIFFLKRIGGIIVEGKQNYLVFSKFVSEGKIHIVPNFADDYLFVENADIIKKFLPQKPLNLLFLSNLIYGKGFQELAEAYTLLESKYQEKINFTFVGGFRDDKVKDKFMAFIEPYKNIKYLGAFIDGEAKKQLYQQTQLFCLPTYYPFEGQPISILEAYASGIVVITTNHSGIPYVFKDKINGFQVEKKSEESIKEVLEYIIDNPEVLLKIALNNNTEASEKYRVAVYQKNIIKIFFDNVQNL